MLIRDQQVLAKQLGPLVEDKLRTAVALHLGADFAQPNVVGNLEYIIMPYIKHDERDPPSEEIAGALRELAVEVAGAGASAGCLVVGISRMCPSRKFFCTSWDFLRPPSAATVTVGAHDRPG